MYGETAQARVLASCSSGFETCHIPGEKLLAPRLTSNLRDQVSAFRIWPSETGWPIYTSRHCVTLDLG